MRHITRIGGVAFCGTRSGQRTVNLAAHISLTLLIAGSVNDVYNTTCMEDDNRSDTAYSIDNNTHIGRHHTFPPMRLRPLPPRTG